MLKIKWVFVFLLLSGAAFAQNPRVDGIALNRGGLPAAGASIAACTQPAVTTTTPCSPLALLCSSTSDVTCTSPNPVTADGLGNYSFYIKTVSGSAYTVQIYGSGLTTQVLKDQAVPIVLTANNVFSGNNTFSGSNTFSNGLTVGSAGIAVSGATSGASTLVASAIASGTLTFPAATDTLVGKATTDTFSNKTIDTTAFTANVLKINGNTLSAVAGTATVSIPNSTDTLVGRATSDALSNKTSLGLTSSAIVSWNADTGLSRNNVGVIYLGDGTVGNRSGTLHLTEIVIPEGGPISTVSGFGYLYADNISHRLAGGSATGGTDKIVLPGTVDTFTNKTYDTAGTGNVLKINGNTVSSVSGNTTKVALVSGSFTSGNAIKSDGSGNLIDAGAPPVGFTCVNVTPVTVNTNTASDQNLMACTITAGALNSVGKTLLIQSAAVYSTPAGSTSTINLKAKLCTVSGCGSGTVITLASWTSAALGAIQATNDPLNITLNASTQTAGATASFEAHGNLTIDISALTTAAEAVYADGNTATVGTIDSTAQLFLQITGAFSNASGSNSMTQRQLIADVID